MNAPWSCSTCGEPGVRNIGVRGYCLAHLVEFLSSLPAHVFSEVGMMLPTGPQQLDWGPGMADCTCVRCGAGHIAAPLEICPWCLDSIDVRNADQVRIVLTPPDVDRDDRTYEATMRGWADRLARAVESGLITQAAASNAWRREVRRVPAA